MRALAWRDGGAAGRWRVRVGCWSLRGPDAVFHARRLGWSSRRPADNPSRGVDVRGQVGYGMQRSRASAMVNR